MGLIPALVEENERLRTSLETSEKEFERLRQEVALLRGESENYRNEREDVADALNKFMNEMLQLVNEVAQKFRTPAQRSRARSSGKARRARTAPWCPRAAPAVRAASAVSGPSGARAGTTHRGGGVQHLQRGQPAVDPVLPRHELLVAPHLRDPSLVHHHHAVRVAHGGQPVRDDEHRPPLGELADSACCTRNSLSASRSEVASSRRRMGGSFRKARAMAMRWRWPPESLTPRSPTRVA